MTEYISLNLHISSKTSIYTWKKIKNKNFYTYLIKTKPMKIILYSLLGKMKDWLKKKNFFYFVKQFYIRMKKSDRPSGMFGTKINTTSNKGVIKEDSNLEDEVDKKNVKLFREKFSPRQMSYSVSNFHVISEEEKYKRLRKDKKETLVESNIEESKKITKHETDSTSIPVFIEDFFNKSGRNASTNSETKEVKKNELALFVGFLLRIHRKHGFFDAQPNSEYEQKRSSSCVSHNSLYKDIRYRTIHQYESEKLHKCSYCDSSYTYKKCLVTHIAKAHKRRTK